MVNNKPIAVLLIDMSTLELKQMEELNAVKAVAAGHSSKSDAQTGETLLGIIGVVLLGLVFWYIRNKYRNHQAERNKQSYLAYIGSKD